MVQTRSPKASPTLHLNYLRVPKTPVASAQLEELALAVAEACLRRVGKEELSGSSLGTLSMYRA